MTPLRCLKMSGTKQPADTASHFRRMEVLNSPLRYHKNSQLDNKFVTSGVG